MSLKKFGLGLRHFLNHPRQVFILCLLFVGFSAVFNGVLWRLWALHRDYDRRLVEIYETKMSIQKLKGQVALAKDPIFIERQARDRLDLAGDSDLVFVFPTQ